jgi:beta-lactamase regulating signal transducer with metallopeptidase domain
MAESLVQQLWLNGLAVVPVALLVALLCRVLPCRPATRHAAWVLTLILLFVPLLVYSMVPGGAVREGISRVVQGTAEDSDATTVEVRSPAPANPIDEATESPTRAIESADRFYGRSAIAPSEPVSTACDEHASQLGLRTTLRPHMNDGGVVPEPSVVSTATPSASMAPALVDATQNARLRSTTERRSLRSEQPLRDTAVYPLHTSDDAAEASRSASASAGEGGLAQWLGAFALDTIAAESRAFGQRLLAVRDALADVPAPPLALWIAGSTVVALIVVARVATVMRMIRRSEAADNRTGALVRRAARALGLRTPPRVVMTARRASPMVWCGPTPTLILPVHLWAHLDTTSRVSIVLHELAHLRRRDHWTCWAELAAGAVYWWHPVVWWVRRRLRDEADYCCDAWVTRLLPAGRRSYAQALLESRRFTSAATLSGPVVGLGAGSRAQRFARRLTMVMTEHRSPGLSRRGVALVATITAMGCLVAPIVACPPEEKVKSADTAAAPAALPESSDASTFEQFMRTREADEAAPPARRAPRSGTVTQQNVRAIAEALAQAGQAQAAQAAAQGDLQRAREILARNGAMAGGDQAALERAMAEAFRRDTVVAQDAAARERAAEAYRRDAVTNQYAAELEAALARGAAAGPRLGGAGGDDRLNQRIGALEERLERLTVMLERLHAGEGASVGAAGGFTTTPQPGVPAAQVPMQPRVPSPPAPPSVSAPAAAPFFDGASDELIVREYALPEGKLEALSELMIREDVPVLVAPRVEDGVIEVHATPQAHRVFEAFVNLIHPQPGRAPSTNSPGGVMRTTPAPVPGRGGAAGAAPFPGGGGGATTPAAPRAPRQPMPPGGGAGGTLTPVGSPTAPAGIAPRHRHREAIEAERMQLEAHLHALEVHQHGHESIADSLEQQLENYAEELERIHEQAAEVEAAADELSEEEHAAIEHQVAALHAHARELQAAAARCEAELVRSIEATASTDHQIAEVEAAIERLEEVMEAAEAEAEGGTVR